MSKKIAPGKWDPWLRMAAKHRSTVIGSLMIAFGLVAGLRLAPSVLEGGDVTTFELVLVGVVAVLPTAIGALAVFPDVLTPIVYRALDEIDRKRQGQPDSDDETA